MEKNFNNEEAELKYILRQIGFGAILGTAFLMIVYLGGWLAHQVSGI
jgi:hypothetical protein